MAYGMQTHTHTQAHTHTYIQSPALRRQFILPIIINQCVRRVTLLLSACSARYDAACGHCTASHHQTLPTHTLCVCMRALNLSDFLKFTHNFHTCSAREPMITRAPSLVTVCALYESAKCKQQVAEAAADRRPQPPAAADLL